jgi:hypothetical protein
MSQTFNLIDGDTDTVSDLDTLTNDMCSALRSSFSGTSAPGTMVGGQWFFNTSTKKVSFYDGSDLYAIFDGNATYGGMLPLSAGLSYPITGDVYLSSTNRIKNVAAPEADNDVTTKGYVRDYMIDEHGHDGLDGEGPRIVWNTLAGGGTTGNTLIQIAHNTTDVQNRSLNYAFTSTGVAVAYGSWTTVQSASVYTNANEKKFIIASATAPHDTDPVSYCKYQILRDSTVVFGPYTLSSTSPGFLFLVCMNQPSTAGTYTWALQGSYDTSGGAGTWTERAIMVI